MSATGDDRDGVLTGMRGSPNRLMAVAFGGGYLLLGAAGFFVTAEARFFDTPGGMLFDALEVNGLHNLVHILIGVALLLAGLRNPATAKTVNALVGTLLLALGLAGLFIVGSPFNVLAINGADNVLHFGSSALLLAVGVGAEGVASAARRGEGAALD